MNENKKMVSFPVAILTLVVVAAIMSVGLAVIKLNTMVTFILKQSLSISMGRFFIEFSF